MKNMFCSGVCNVSGPDRHCVVHVHTHAEAITNFFVEKSLQMF